MEETTQQTNQEAIPGQPLDWAALVDDLNRLLRLKTTVIGMKLYEDEAALAGVKGLRRPKATHTTDQIRFVMIDSVSTTLRIIQRRWSARRYCRPAR